MHRSYLASYLDLVYLGQLTRRNTRKGLNENLKAELAGVYPIRLVTFYFLTPWTR